jgi:hypothetical protein
VRALRVDAAGGEPPPEQPWDEKLDRWVGSLVDMMVQTFVTRRDLSGEIAKLRAEIAELRRVVEELRAP